MTSLIIKASGTVIVGCVCTVVISLAPAEPMPLLLLGFRDELTGRPWLPPARHWPESPLVGGRDEQAGGTWLAVHPQIPRVACILNGRGAQAPPQTRRSRGELPLRAAAEGQQALNDLRDHLSTLARYDPFLLICADLSSALMLSWDGTRAALENFEPNQTHIITNAGHAYPPAPDQAPEQAPAQADAKARHFGPKFAAHRPDADPAATIKDAWVDWLTLADGDGLSDTDPAAIVVRHELPDGRVYGTTSVSLVALGAHALRYDFQPVPADPTTWYPVDLQPR
jgi:Transport and Golgi organisation 2